MSQGYSIQLYFDPALENQVLKAWNVLARRQISTQLIEIESRPHIPLFSTPTSLDPSKIESLVRTLASKQEPIKLNFASIGSFTDEGNTLFVSPTPTLSLLHFQTHLCDVLRKEGIDIPDDFCVDSWHPICPLAQNVPKSRVSEAFTVLRDLKLPVCGYGLDVGLVQFSPVRELCSFMLANVVD